MKGGAVSSGGIVLDGERFAWFPLDEIQVREQIQVEHWLRTRGAEFTDARTWDDLLAIAAEINSLPDRKEQEKHPDFKLSLAVMVWACMVGAGREVALGDQLGRWRWKDLEFFDEPAPETDAGKGHAAEM